MSNLHEAAKQALDFCEFLWREVAMNDYAEEKREAVEAALRAALAEPIQEPVAWANMKDGEPVLLSISQHPEDRANWMNPVPLYTHPPYLRALTDQQIIAAIKNISFNEMTAFNIARAIEKARGIGVE